MEAENKLLITQLLVKSGPGEADDVEDAGLWWLSCMHFLVEELLDGGIGGSMVVMIGILLQKMKAKLSIGGVELWRMALVKVKGFVMLPYRIA